MSIPQTADLREVADARAREARLLLGAREFSGAYYLAGLALECALKATLTSALIPYAMPDKKAVGSAYIHDLESLANQADVSDELNQDAQVAASWLAARAWSVDSRYQSWTELEANDMVEACLDEKKGVYPWLSARW